MKRVFFVFCVLFVSVFSIFAQQQDKYIGKSNLPPENMKDVIYFNTLTRYQLYWDAYQKISDGSIYKIFSKDSFCLVAFAKDLKKEENVFIGKLKEIPSNKLLAWTFDKDGRNQPFNVSNLKINIIDGQNIINNKTSDFPFSVINNANSNYMYVVITGIPENISKISVWATYTINVDGAKTEDRYFVISANVIDEKK